MRAIPGDSRTSRLFARLLPVLVAGTALLAAACGRGGGGPAMPRPPEQMPPPLSLYTDNGGGIRDSVRIIVRDNDALRTWWQQATSTQASPPPLPAVDFGREMVIIAAAGRQTPEEQIHVDSLLVRPELMPQGREQEVLTVVVRTVVGCGRMRTAAYPVVIVRARRFDGPIRWRDNKEQLPCSSPRDP